MKKTPTILAVLSVLILMAGTIQAAPGDHTILARYSLIQYYDDPGILTINEETCDSDIDTDNGFGIDIGDNSIGDSDKGYYIPEPATITLLGFGLMGLRLFKKRRKN